MVIHNEKSILGEDTAQKVELTQADLKAAFSSFASFLRASHGVPTLESTTGPREVVASWEIQALMRERTVQNIQDAIQKLGAIARQVNEIQNMRIPKAVQEDVKSALAALASVSQTLYHQISWQRLRKGNFCA